MDYQVIGEVRHIETKKCLDNMGRKENEKVGFFNCHGQGGNQVFGLTKQNEIKHDDLCLDASSNTKFQDIVMLKCHGKHGNQEWRFNQNSKTITHNTSGLCLEKSKHGKDTPTLVKCNGSSVQQWELVGVPMTS